MLNDLILNLKQNETLTESLKYRLFAFVGGIRGGKTITGSHWALRNILSRPNEKGGIFSNTNKQLNQATLSEFIKVLDFYGLHRGVYYVTGKDPERFFGYKSKFDRHDGVWSFANGAQVIVFSIETMIRGIELGWCWGDEVQDAPVESLNVVLGRMSGSATPNTLWTMTPPANNPGMDNLIYGENSIPHVISTTYDNAANLPEGYVEGLRERYDDLWFDREVLAKRVTMSGRNWLYAFDRTRHVGKVEYVPDLPVYVSIDFNVSPFVAVLAQRGGGGRQAWVHYFDEVVMRDTEVGSRTYIEALCEAIRQRTPQAAERNLYYVTGDASGRAQSVISRPGVNYWTEVAQYLRVGYNKMNVPSSNPPLVESRRLCNAIFAKFPDIKISPKCATLIMDCEFVKAKNGAEIDKSSRANVHQRADALDALRYDLQANNAGWVER
jgi:hypothetical protein